MDSVIDNNNKGPSGSFGGRTATVPERAIVLLLLPGGIQKPEKNSSGRGT
jgi:hypothetical protein